MSKGRGRPTAGAIGVVAVACCAGPAIAGAAGGAGLAAWLGTRGAWLAALVVVVIVGVATITLVRRRHHTCDTPAAANVAEGVVGILVPPERRAEARGASLPPAQRDLYRWILTELAAGRSPTRDAIFAQAARCAGDGDGALSAMADLDLVHLDDATGTVRCAYPFSGVPTAHAVNLASNGAGPTAVYAMCAVDALGMPALVGGPAKVTSHDPGTGGLVSVAVGPCGEPVSTPHDAVVVIAAAEGGGSMEALCCPSINFFESRRSAERYLEKNDLAASDIFTIPEATAIGRKLFGGVLA